MVCDISHENAVTISRIGNILYFNSSFQLTIEVPDNSKWYQMAS